MKAMILAAGYGKRLLPLTKETPKPLLKVGNKTLIQHNIEHLIKNDFTEFVINISHLGNMIENHVKEKFSNINIVFSKEDKPLGTGGGILNAIDLLGDENFLVMNSDIFHRIDIKNLPKERKLVSWTLDSKAEGKEQKQLQLSDPSVAPRRIRSNTGHQSVQLPCETKGEINSFYGV